MAEEKKRVALSLPDDMDEVITELARRMGTPKTTVIMSVLESGLPALKKTLFVMRKVQDSQEKGVLGAMKNMMLDAGFNFSNSHDGLSTEKKGGKK